MPRRVAPPVQPFEPDPRQAEAIAHLHGPMLVVAGAGTGKTTTLTRRIVRLVQEGHAHPGEVLSLTYTVNAAKEMSDRVARDLKGGSAVPRTSTFHDYCFSLLCRNRKEFGVLDDKDLWIFLRRNLRELKLKLFIRAANLGEFLNDLIDFMRRCQDELVTPERYAQYVAELEAGLHPLPRVARGDKADTMTPPDVLDRCREISRVYSTVERLLAERNFGTFGHQITRAYDLLRADAQVLASERQRARFLLVDEFQDANFAQVKIMDLLAGDERNVFAVGDPDQGIYRFRGASSAAFKLFERHFPDSRLVVLGNNRRSTTPILRCAFAAVNVNPQVFDGSQPGGLAYQRVPLESARDQAVLARGELLDNRPVEAVFAEKDHEAVDIVQTIQQMHRNLRCRWDKFAVLFRYYWHTGELVEELGKRGIPFTVENMDVMDTAEVRDLLACLGVIVQPSDAVSLFRVAALPRFQIRPEDFRAAMNSASRSGDAPVHSRIREGLNGVPGGAQLLQTVDEARAEIAGGTMSIALPVILRRFGIDSASPPVAAFLNFAQSWQAKAATDTGQIAEFMEYLDLFREAGGNIPAITPDVDAVRLITAHSAKGLEYDHIFVVRAYSQCFPGKYREPLFELPSQLRDKDSAAEADSRTLQDQEERRLFYVAMTRARETLTLYAKSRTPKKHAPPKGILAELVNNPTLRRYLRERKAQEFQTELYAQEAPPAEFVSRTAEWLRLRPFKPLHARLSATAVENYERCPLQFKLDRDWNIPGEVPAAMHYGAAVHAVLRAFFDSVRAERRLGLDRVLELFCVTFDATPIDDDYQRDLYRNQGIAQLTDFVQSLGEDALPEVLRTESFFEVRMGETVVAGRVDRVDRIEGNRVRVIDYKTGKAKSQEDADQSLQLSIYAIAAKEMWGYDVDAIQFYNLNGNVAFTSQRSPETLQEARDRIQNAARSIESGDFQPKPDPFTTCRYCAYRTLCPETEKRSFLLSAVGAAAKA